jgi:hypothetical protein
MRACTFLNWNNMWKNWTPILQKNQWPFQCKLPASTTSQLPHTKTPYIIVLLGQLWYKFNLIFISSKFWKTFSTICYKFQKSSQTIIVTLEGSKIRTSTLCKVILLNVNHLNTRSGILFYFIFKSFKNCCGSIIFIH